MLFHNSCIEIVSFSWKKIIILFYSFFAIIYLKNSSWIIISSVVSASQEYTLYKSLFYFLVLMNIYLHSQFGFFFSRSNDHLLDCDSTRVEVKKQKQPWFWAIIQARVGVTPHVTSLSAWPVMGESAMVIFMLTNSWQLFLY